MDDLSGRIGRLLTGLTSTRDDAVRVATAPATARADRELPEAVAALLRMPLDRYAREGASLEIRVPWCPDTLWFVPAEADAHALQRDGVGRGRIWTASELIALMAMPDLTLATVQTITRTKLALDGDIVEVRPRSADVPSKLLTHDARSGDQHDR